jgi:hypothetical protein
MEVRWTKWFQTESDSTSPPFSFLSCAERTNSANDRHTFWCFG